MSLALSIAHCSSILESQASTGTCVINDNPCPGSDLVHSFVDQFACAVNTFQCNRSYETPQTIPGAITAAVRADAYTQALLCTRPQIGYSTNWRLVIENTGSSCSEQLIIELVAAGDGEPPMIFKSDHPVQRLAPGNRVACHVVVMGTAMQWDIELRWREGDREFTDVQTIRP
jgi:hypothetical protein